MRDRLLDKYEVQPPLGKIDAALRIAVSSLVVSFGLLRLVVRVPTLPRRTGFSCRPHPRPAPPILSRRLRPAHFEPPPACTSSRPPHAPRRDPLLLSEHLPLLLLAQSVRAGAPARTISLLHSTTRPNYMARAG